MTRSAASSRSCGGQTRGGAWRWRVRSTAAPTPRTRRAVRACRRSSGTAWAAKRRPGPPPRTGLASSCRCGRAPRRWRPGSADGSSCRLVGHRAARRHPTPLRHRAQLYKLSAKCHANSPVTMHHRLQRSVSTAPIDITSHDFWSQPFDERDETFAQLRAADGLTWHRAAAVAVRPGGARVLGAHPARRHRLRQPASGTVHLRAQGVALDPMPAEVQRFASFFLTMDPPQHTVYRRLISSAFTPRNVRRIEEQIHDTAVEIVDDLVGAGDDRLRRRMFGAAADADHHGHARCARRPISPRWR